MTSINELMQAPAPVWLQAKEDLKPHKNMKLRLDQVNMECELSDETSCDSARKVSDDAEYNLSKEELVRLYSMDLNELHNENVAEFREFRVRAIRVIRNFYAVDEIV
jgi:hypothetical protein